jgi:hypothetical protein
MKKKIKMQNNISLTINKGEQPAWEDESGWHVSDLVHVHDTKCGCRGNAQDDILDKKPIRPSCLECVEKHLGAAMVLCSEIREGYSYRLLVIGHLHEAAEESQEYPELHHAIREARKAYQNDNVQPNWELLGALMERTKENKI